jgi:hypothetical protein
MFEESFGMNNYSYRGPLMKHMLKVSLVKMHAIVAMILTFMFIREQVPIFVVKNLL